MTQGLWVYLTCTLHNSRPLEWDVTTSSGTFRDLSFSCPPPPLPSPSESAAPPHYCEAYFNLVVL